MRTTTTTKSFTIALVLATVLATPIFADREDARRKTLHAQEPTLIQRIVNRIKHVFDAPTITHPGEAPTTTT